VNGHCPVDLIRITNTRFSAVRIDLRQPPPMRRD